jgi:hypothetical protein
VLFKQRQRTIFPILKTLQVSRRSVPLASGDKLIRIKTVPAYKKLACTFIDLGRNLSARSPLWVMCGRRLGKNFLTLLQHWSGAVMCPACLCGGEAAGHDALRGSGPNRKRAL